MLEIVGTVWDKRSLRYKEKRTQIPDNSSDFCDLSGDESVEVLRFNGSTEVKYIKEGEMPRTRELSSSKKILIRSALSEGRGRLIIRMKEIL